MTYQVELKELINEYVPMFAEVDIAQTNDPDVTELNIKIHELADKYSRTYEQVYLDFVNDGHDLFQELTGAESKGK